MRLLLVRRVVSVLTILTVITWQRPVTIEANAAEQTLLDGCTMVNKDRSKIICICTEQKCDDLKFEWPTAPGQAFLVETTQSGRRFEAKRLDDAIVATSENVSSTSASSKHVLSVDLDKQRQEVLGWGGAFTDAAAINIQALSGQMKERLIESYFGANGLQYNFGRVPIGGSDFSTRAYSYDDTNEPDLNLTKWSLADEDLTYKIPTIKRAIEVAKTTDGTDLKLFASPWSPPKWMKTSNDFKRGHLIDKDEIYRSYANYLVKFYQSYRDHGIEFWGATVQNEPVAANLPFYFFNSLQMSYLEVIKFVANYLGPALESFGYTKQNFKLMVGDDSLGMVNSHVESVMENKQVQKYVSGFAFHWYLSGFLVPYDTLTRIINKIGSNIEFVMMSESCQGAFLSTKHVDLGDWPRGESYASDIIEDFKRQTGAWIDWNLALDFEGGPNWSRNFVDSPIIVDKVKNEFIKQPMYYTLAHFSKFMRPGSFVVDSTTKNGISVIAAHIKSTGHLVVNILNKSNGGKEFPLEVNSGTKTLYTIKSIQVEPRSVSTIVVKL